MVGVGCASEVSKVASHAISTYGRELPIRMALITGHTGVGAGERKSRKCVVVEAGGLPGRGVVACLALLRETGLDMRWVSGFLEVRKVTSHTSGGRTLELPAHVTIAALQLSMGSKQCEPGDFQVIEFRSRPGVQAVALFAVRRKASCLVGR